MSTLVLDMPTLRVLMGRLRSEVMSGPVRATVGPPDERASARKAEPPAPPPAGVAGARTGLDR